jgi:hypothetical protein
MTEFQFFEELEAYQKNFEKLNYIFIRDMHKYIRKSTVYDSTFFKTIVIFSANITLTAAWIKLLKDFNSDKCNNILRFSPDFNHSNGVSDSVRPLTDVNINPFGGGVSDHSGQNLSPG